MPMTMKGKQLSFPGCQSSALEGKYWDAYFEKFFCCCLQLFILSLKIILLFEKLFLPIQTSLLQLLKSFT